MFAGVLFGVDAGGLRSKLLSSTARPQIRSLAVLPLANLSGDPQQEYFADAMTEELISELSRISALKVISRTSVMQYKGEKRKPLPQIGRELNVDAVMEGSVLRSGNQVRIAAHVIYAPTDQSLMTETYENDLGDVLKLQREVAEAVTQKVRLKLTAGEKAHLRSAPEVNQEAYDAYLLATSLNRLVPPENEEARSYLEKAIQIDPGLAQAYAVLSWRYLDRGQYRWQSPQEAYPPAKQAARKALELDPNNCPAHAALAWLAERSDWDWAATDREYQVLLELCPSSFGAHADYALYTAWNRRAADAAAEIAKCRELDPLNSEPVWQEAMVHYHLRDYKALIEVSRRFTTSRPTVWLAHYWLGVGYEGSGQVQEAIPEYQKAVDLSQGDQDPTAAMAHAYAAIDRNAEAKKILSEFLRQSKTQYVSPYMIATVYAGLGDKGKAFEYLENAYQEKSSDLPYFLRADLRMDSLRSDPRFQDLLHRMNFPK
jgi:TolB-like protein/Flp pilus assembly protein TadD